MTPGGETAELLRDHPTTPLLTSTFSLADADLTIEAVAVDNANAAAVRNGIDIRFPQAAYDSVAGGSGGVTTADGLRLGVADLSSIPARLSLMDIRNTYSRRWDLTHPGQEADGGTVDLPLSVVVSDDVGSFEAEVELTGVTEPAAPATAR